MKAFRYMVAVSLLLTLGWIWGCGSSTTSQISQGGVLRTGSLVVSAAFPGSDGAVKSLIPTNAAKIEVYARRISFSPYSSPFGLYSTNMPGPTNYYGEKIADLTPASPSARVDLVAGYYMITGIAFDLTDPMYPRQIAFTSTGGEVLAGQSNRIVLTFLDGQWTLVDANDNPSPLVLSNGTRLVDMIVGADQQQPMYKVGKSLFDLSKPFGFEYVPVRLRFDNNTSAMTEGFMAAQFTGTNNSIAIDTENYNLTKRCGFYNYYGMPCEVRAGDQVVMIVSNVDVYGEPSYGSSMLNGNPYALLPNNGGKTKITQNGTVLQLDTMVKETTVTGGNVMTGSLVEWLPSTVGTWNLGTPASAAKAARSGKVVKAQSANTPYTNLTITDYEPLVCSGTNPQNRGTWSFANTTSAGKIVIGSRVCYRDGWLQSQWDPITMTNVTNAGDYSWGLAPADMARLGDYCHVWDWNTNTCGQQLPGTGELYIPWNFRAKKSPTKTTIDYGSFRYEWWGERVQQGSAYIYDFRAKGSSTVTRFTPPSP